MFISSLHIERFRPFNKNDFKIGKYVTAIAGFNCTGKSTILGLLGHCGELKGYKPLLHSGFRAELSEIIKFSDNHDKKISDIGTITFEDLSGAANSGYPDSISYRSTWQKHGDSKRYRIIPKKTSLRPKEKKVTWPTLYLGLGRLYPIGESDHVEETRLAGKLSDVEKHFILDNMVSILSSNEQPNDFTAASIAETRKKKAIGLNTDNYDYLCNSAGQDSLGQILIAVLSFKRLKEQLGDQWHGGLLLIDELDATLHPLAQNKLVKFLYDQAQNIGMQVVFTTHSLGLLDYLCKRTEYNSDIGVNNYEVTYIKNANGPIEVNQNPPFEVIFNDLMATYEALDSRKLSVFSEDEESRFFIQKLLEKYAYRFNLLEASFGWASLLGMLASDYGNFCRFVYVLDGDVDDGKIAEYAQKVPVLDFKCVVKLPGGKRPEQVLWEYLDSMQADHPFLEWGNSRGYSIRSLKENGPDSGRYKQYSEDRNKYKYWFKDNKPLASKVFDFWYVDHKTIVDEFVKDFITAYNWVALKCFIPKIVF